MTTACEMCGSGEGAAQYHVIACERGEHAAAILCPAHAAPFEYLLAMRGKVEVKAKPKQRRSRRQIVATTMDEIEASKNASNK